ncbi:hypothetical protein BC938DRAFT_484277 [Jimgerdemannia flammicorona]|uniref:Uncharacterized protein n=1 Tax=Jimgerdemannia flammicorona TaxID=994334 RepID=A0A433QAB8_9FUNG|nr:hypothetical protein BC938DRAFT_484277 [Jimgerdemannia flammicorona]
MDDQEITILKIELSRDENTTQTHAETQTDSLFNIASHLCPSHHRMKTHLPLLNQRPELVGGEVHAVEIGEAVLALDFINT